MNCGHDQLNIQDFNEKINGFKSTYDLVYFLIDWLSQIKYKKWSYFFCADYQYRRKCGLCVIADDFNDFEELIREKILDRNFLFDYHEKLVPYLRCLFFAKKRCAVVFLMTFILTIIECSHNKNSGRFIWRKLLMNYWI